MGSKDRVVARQPRHVSLAWVPRRRATPRQQTLSATLDWSYNLLPEVERSVLRRLSVFVGRFSLDAAQVVAAGGAVDGWQVVESTDNLVLSRWRASTRLARRSGTVFSIRPDVIFIKGWRRAVKPLRFRAGMQSTIGTYLHAPSQSGQKPKVRRRGAITSVTFVLPWTGVSHRRLDEVY
jgi:hypothetical protein